MADASRDKGIDDIADLAEQAEELARHAAALAERLRAVRGTKNGSKVRLPLRQPIPDERYTHVRQLLEAQPMTLRQIVDATPGIKSDDDIKVVITNMQRHKIGIVNLGAANKALWFIPSEKARERLRGNDDDGED